MSKKKIGEAIAAARKEQGISIRELAAKSGRDTRAVQAVIGGKYSYGIDTLTDIAAALGLKVELR